MGNIYLEYAFANEDHINEHRERLDRNERNLSVRWFGQDAVYAYKHGFFSGCSWQWDDDKGIDENMDTLETFLLMMRSFAQKCKMFDLNLEESDAQEIGEDGDESEWGGSNPCSAAGSGAGNGSGFSVSPARRGDPEECSRAGVYLTRDKLLRGGKYGATFRYPYH